MALDFPDSPNNGDFYEGFVYNSTTGAWRITKALVAGPLLEFLVCAGGGGGSGGGGGGGGFVCSVTGTASGGGLPAYEPFDLVSGTSYSVSIGAGGASGNLTSTAGSDGSPTTFGPLTLSGGGGGAGEIAGGPGSNGRNGGSGGGAASWSNSSSASGGTSVFSQGFRGGNVPGVSSYASGGGGGAGGPGVDATGNTDNGSGSPGGPGVLVNITGTEVEYSQGGTGYWNTSGTGSSPANTGKGGDGKNTSGGGSGFAGGSGVVILRYPSTESLTIDVGLTSTTTTIGNNKVTTITAGSGTVTVD